MIVVLVLAVATLGARGLGEAGLAYFDSWPAPQQMVIATGVFEFLGAAGLLMSLLPVLRS
ncbi:MAG TPA: hypothetical protein VGM64_17305 [Lacunisphaera sp.]|jgi:hypothetical protein